MATPATAEVIIIGGGVIGLSIARSLALRGANDVMLIERSQFGSEASSAAAGMLAPQAEADTDDEFFRLLCHSRDLYDSFAAALLNETGIDIELDKKGTLYLAFTERDEEEIRRRHEWETRAGLAIEELDSSEACLLEPAINPAVRSALRFPRDVQVENRRLVSALSESVNNLGVAMLTETEVEAIEVRRHRVISVRTSRGSISCSKVVMAGGCWTSKIDIEDTENDEHRLKPVPLIGPVRGQMLCLATKPLLVGHVIYSPRGYLVPRRDGRLLAGSTSEHAGYAKHVTAGGVSTILRNAHEISPAVATLPLIDSWAGLRPRAPDGLPVIGPCDEIDGLIYATGHYRNGILLAPVTGELIADVVFGTPDVKLSNYTLAFSPNRFKLVRT